MILHSELNPYKKLLEEQDFLPFVGKKGNKIKFKKDYKKFQKRILTKEEFDFLDFENNKEEIKEIIENYINDIIKNNHDYMDTEEYLNNTFVNSIGRGDFNNLLNEDSLRVDDIFYDDFYELLNEKSEDYNSIVKDFWNENKDQFDIDFTKNDYRIGDFYQREEWYSHYFRDDDVIEIFGKEYNFIDLMYYLPTEFIKSLKLEDNINDEIIRNIKDKEKSFDIQFVHDYGYHSINVYLQNYDEVKDLFKQYLIDNGYLGVKSDDNTVWEEE